MMALYCGLKSVFDNHPSATMTVYFAAHALKSGPTASIFWQRIYDVHSGLLTLMVHLHLSPRSHQPYFAIWPPALCTPHRLCVLRRRFGGMSITWCERNPLIWRWEVVVRQMLEVGLLAAPFPFAYPSYRRTNMLYTLKYISRCCSCSFWLVFRRLIFHHPRSLRTRTGNQRPIAANVHRPPREQITRLTYTQESSASQRTRQIPKSFSVSMCTDVRRKGTSARLLRPPGLGLGALSFGMSTGNVELEHSSVCALNRHTDLSIVEGRLQFRLSDLPKLAPSCHSHAPQMRRRSTLII